jgi:hypothetical protein
MGSNREKYHIPFDPYVINAYREFFNIELQYGVQLILGDIDLILDRQLVAPVLFLHVTLQTLGRIPSTKFLVIYSDRVEVARKGAITYTRINSA